MELLYDVHCGCLPPKLDQIIQPLMAAVSPNMLDIYI